MQIFHFRPPHAGPLKPRYENVEFAFDHAKAAGGIVEQIRFDYQQAFDLLHRNARFVREQYAGVLRRFPFRDDNGSARRVFGGR